MDNNNIMKPVSFLNSFVKSSTSTRTKEDYTLDQILTIIVLKDKEVTTKSISEYIGHSTHSVTYKIGWIKSFVTKHVSDTYPQLYKMFKVTLPDDIDVDIIDRVEKLIKSLTVMSK